MPASNHRRVSPNRLILRKRLGQHHLREGALCAALIEYLRPHGRRVVEIGPGGGVLTRELLLAGAEVLALELDLRWGFELAARLEGRSFALVVADALELDWRRLSKGTLVAGNLPFNISTALILGLLPCWARVPRAGFLVQQEVADRLLAEPGHRAYGALTVLTRARAEVELLGRVAPGSFFPTPKVAGAFVGLELRAPPLQEAQMGGFADTVRAAFAQRRKQLRNALAAAWGRVEAERVLTLAALDPRCRAEDLSIDQFLALHRARQTAANS